MGKKAALLESVNNNNLEAVRKLLKSSFGGLFKGVDANEALDENGWTALMAACREGFAEIAELLIENGADVNQAKTDNGWTSLMAATSNKHIKTVQFLITKGADVNKACTDDGWTVLMSASDAGAADIAKLLIKNGADVNQAKTDNGWTSLMSATANNHIKTVQFLITKGADVNKACTDDGWTALMAATANKHINTVQLLITKGADVNKARTDSGWTALMTASDAGAADIAELLIENGADVNQARRDTGWTALMVACREGHIEVARLLVAHGANPAAKTTDEKNSSVLDIAKASEKQDIVGFLTIQLVNSMYMDLTGEPLTLGTKVITDSLLAGNMGMEDTSKKSYRIGIVNFMMLNGLSIDKNKKHNGMIIVKDMSQLYEYSHLEIGPRKCPLEKYVQAFGYSLFIDPGYGGGSLKFEIRRFLRGHSLTNTLSITLKDRADDIEEEESSQLFPVILDEENLVKILQDY